MKNNKNSIFEIRKYLNKKGFVIKKKEKNLKEKSGFDTLSRTFLSSLIIISIFFITPIVIDLTKKNMIFSKDFENNSKSSLKKLLENQGTKLDDILDSKFLFEDILKFDEPLTDAVRLSAATIEELFKSTNYNLEDVRKNKLVKPISLTLLPLEIKKIENVKKRKNLFIQIILPLVIKENNNIRLDRKKLFTILNKSKNTKIEKDWLNSKFKQYGVVNKDLSTLKIRMDEIPVSMAIETGISSILIFNVDKSLLTTPYCLNFEFNQSFSIFVFLLLFKIVKSFFRSNLILLFSLITSGKII